ncbi:hypothetical protein PICMEDRAFT_58887 [Pichia membranifaciens NRRL Y-2026]|uniref:Golgi to ER traffic protein 4 n=1 Tax=Pichia membranifaciens NRRL Y-2026 TaxID=763406 RepID=A0A1E3NKE1_9ASCO|nr:hypothetical protein PICMEDRAFT_58887 [Pichia membranifaciens NRRL Y-2026]ODQ46625.1 hypothetical protein PICMEDRAFT_58887 [Pichia membranifaciens NRRL Y-2026]
MSSIAIETKLKKSLARFRERINNGSYYEAQQTIRSITNRYVHSKNYEAAISLLYQSTMILLESKQYDEAADLYLYMLEVLQDENKSVEEFETADLGKIVNILSTFPNTDANLASLAKDTSKFVNAKVGSDVGLPKINLLLGTKLLQSGVASQIGQSERYLFLTSDVNALKLIVELEYHTFKAEGKPEDFGLYLSRVVLPYLAIKNVKFAELALKKMLEDFQEDAPSKRFQSVNGMLIFEADGDSDLDDCYKLINFLQLLLALAKRGSKDDTNIFSLILKRYQNVLKGYEGLFERINEIAVTYYNISFIKKQSNLLQDMMGSFLGGGK